jgi:hypothetical protein
MKKVKIDQDKVIKIKPRMVKEGVDSGSFLFILIFIALVIFMLTSCGETPKYKQPEPQNNELSKDSKYYNLNVEEYTYEGCEYIRINKGNSAWGSHKGNCKNPIHKENGSN